MISRADEHLKLTQIDVGLQLDSVLIRHKRLIVFDMDSTLIRQEIIDELAREAGVYGSISAITESAM
jgi:phosphoserine phosphatase